METGDLRELTIEPNPISHDSFVLYKDGPLPLTKEKMQDLRKLAKQCPKGKRGQCRFKIAGPDSDPDADGGTDDEEPDELGDIDSEGSDDDEGGSSSA